MRAGRKKASKRAPVGCPWTDGQYEAMLWAEQGCSGKEVAHRLGISLQAAYARLYTAQHVLGYNRLKPTVDHMRRLNWHEPPLPPAQRLYLQAFDRFLAAIVAHDDKLKHLARAQMSYLVPTLFFGVERTPPKRPGRRERRSEEYADIGAMLDLLVE